MFGVRRKIKKCISEHLVKKTAFCTTYFSGENLIEDWETTKATNKQTQLR